MSGSSILRMARALIAIMIFGVVGGCAGTSTTESDAAPMVSNRSAMWEDGAKAVDTGEAMVTKREKRLEPGRQQVRDGEARIRSGNERSEKARQEYEDAASNESASEQEQANALREIGLRWKKAIQEIKEGNKLVAKGKANIDRGESEIREGRSLMETGSILMRNAHRSRLGLSLLPLPKS